MDFRLIMFVGMTFLLTVMGKECSKVFWDVLICRKGDRIKGQADLILVEGQTEPYDLSPVILLCRNLPCRSSFPGICILDYLIRNNKH